MEDILNLVTCVPENRNYWFVRTHGGLLYDSFLSSNSIGISWNKISVEDTDLKEEELTEKVKILYPKNIQPSHTAKQIIKFAKGMKKGDIVLIPSKNSSEIFFGEIIDDEIYVDKDDRGISRWQEKRRKISWLKRKNRDKLDSQIYKLIYSRHTISSGKRCAQVIDQVLNDFYIKGNEAYLILDVQTQKGIQANSFFGMGNSILNILNDFNNITNSNINIDEIDVTISLHSPGTITFKGTAKAMMALGFLIVVIAGGGFMYENKAKLNTDGLIKNIIEYQNNQHERQMKDEVLHKYMDKLEVKTPEDLAKVMEAVTYKKENP